MQTQYVKKNGDGKDNAIWVYDGIDTTKFPDWKKHTIAQLHSLPNTVERRSWGMKIYTWTSGTARDVFKERDLMEFYHEGGWEIMLSDLAERFPQKNKTSRKLEVLDSIFDAAMKGEENAMDWTGRMRGLYSDGVHFKVELDPEIRGYLMLKGAGVTRDQRAMIMASNGQSLEEEEVASAMRNIFPQGFRKSKFFGHWTSGNGDNKTFKQSEQMRKKSVKKTFSSAAPLHPF